MNSNIDLDVDGHYYTFSEGIKGGFNQDDLTNSNCRFTTIRTTLERYQISLKNYNSLTIKTQVKHDLDDENVEPAAIFKKYGSHFLR